MPAKRTKQGGNASSNRAKPQGADHGQSKSQGAKQADKKGVNASESHEEQQVYHFQKDEIVWAKMKFFSAWPAKVCSHSIQIPYSSRYLAYCVISGLVRLKDAQIGLEMPEEDTGNSMKVKRDQNDHFKFVWLAIFEFWSLIYTTVI